MNNVTIINHTIRLKQDLSLSEYCIIDLFYTDWKGANSLTRRELGDMFGMSKASVITCLKKMIADGLMQTDGKFVTTTEKWSALFDAGPEEKIIPGANGTKPIWMPKNTKVAV
jgi:hypothetical protein